MCGIVGLFLKNQDLEPELGRHTATMLEVLSDRGPDSTGFAIYGASSPDHVKLTLRASPAVDFREIAEMLSRELAVSVPLTVHADHAVIVVPAEQEAPVRARIAGLFPGVVFAGSGSSMELYKGVGRPHEVSQRFGLPGMGGTHAIGHTRMATEVGGDDRRCAPVLHGPRSMSGP